MTLADYGVIGQWVIYLAVWGGLTYRMWNAKKL